MTMISMSARLAIDISTKLPGNVKGKLRMTSHRQRQHDESYGLGQGELLNVVFSHSTRLEDTLSHLGSAHSKYSLRLHDFELTNNVALTSSPGL